MAAPLEPRAPAVDFLVDPFPGEELGVRYREGFLLSSGGQGCAAETSTRSSVHGTRVDLIPISADHCQAQIFNHSQTFLHILTAIKEACVLF